MANGASSDRGPARGYEAEVVRATLAAVDDRFVDGGDGCAEIHQLTGGASRSTWLATCGTTRLVVQRQRPETGREMSAEAEVLRAAAGNGVKVPALVEFVIASDGAPTLVTQQVAGETIARRILRDDRFAHARQRLVGDLGATAAAIHSIDTGAVARLNTVLDPIAEYRERLDEIGEPHPTFELAFRWLDEHRPVDRPPAVVHGDLRLGNVIVDEHGLAAVIDWELAHLGNPIEDLGWLCVPAWRFGQTAPVAGIGERHELLAAYAAAGGPDVSLDELRWWEVFGTLKWGVICVMQANTHLSGAARNHELAAIGRRTCETELDLFVALKGSW